MGFTLCCLTRTDVNYTLAYLGRGLLKSEKLNDTQGALADFDRSIKIDPNKPLAYARRAILKYQKLNDRAGGINDIKQAAKLFQQQGNIQRYQIAIDLLKKWQLASKDGGFYFVT